MSKRRSTFTESTLKKALSKLLFEYSGATQSRSTAAGRDLPKSAPTYDKLAGKLGDEDTTVPSELPLEPSDMMASQLATERPPVEDDEFVPANTSELGKAASILTGMIPSDSIDGFYKKLKDLVDSEVDEDTDVMPLGAEEKMPTEFDQGVPNPGTGPQLEAILREVYGEETPLEDLAPVMGYKGPSGARQEIEKMLVRSKFWAENATMQEIARLKTIAVGTFIDGLLSGGFIDDDEAIELQQSPAGVMELPSFQFFFVSSMIQPAYKEIRKQAENSAMEVIERLNLPRRSVTSYVNQVMNYVPRSTRKLRLKIIKDAMDPENGLGVSQREAESIAVNAVNQFPDVVRAAKLGTDFVGIATEKFHSMGNRKLSLLVRRALEDTGTEQDLEAATTPGMEPVS